jgi:hypothetical protein
MSISREYLAIELAATHDLDEGAAREAVAVYADQLGADPGDLGVEDAAHIRRALEVHLAHDVGTPLDAVADATETKRAADEDAADADRVWRDAIRRALTAGQRVVDIAEAAGISRERVYQIRDGRRC